MKIDSLRTKRLYDKLLRVAPDLKQIQQHSMSMVAGLMDLHLDVVECKCNYMRIALSHYWKHPSGDMIADPDMEVGVYWDSELAEALIYQDAFLYEVAYQQEDEVPDLETHAWINKFLEHWLDHLAEHGYVIRRSH